ncbi:cytochrome P450 family 6 protein [Rhizoctonia solani 123E]|uniref:Cytochrome P450 family 6 protein n=1 Tax=Rhizoctonia solani 123E TaxID=1423351 RepID=A0A074S487_9AGAM|nr:cytochrome P450 family 6 protein [Rhizoctonia solani 123E]
MNSTTYNPFNWDIKTLPLEVASSLADNQLAVGSVAAAAAGLVWYLLRSDDSQVKRIRALPFFGQWAFFTKRYDFIVDGFRKLPQETAFGFGVLGHDVVALRGEEARKAFFSRSDLSFTEGYQLLFGGGPSTKDIVKDKIVRNDQEELSFFLRHLAPLLKMDRLAGLTPDLMSDIERNMDTWGETGKFDPFEVMYSTVFQLTIRVAGAREIADSMEKCKQLEELYWKVEKGSTAASLLLPWLPSSARKQKVSATTEIYTIFDDIIKTRQRENRREEDALQIFIDQGDSTVDIIGFIMGTLFAGIVNTGLMSAWIFIFLDQVPEWRDKVIDEIRALLNKYAPIAEGSDSTAERFSRIPAQVWENEMPVLETCIRETIRLIISGAALRRLTSGDTVIDGKKVPNGTFLAYLLGETHSDPNIYPNPSQFNPGRYTEEQDKSQTYGFLGWGVGRHPCAGRRFAQFEIKSMVAMFLASYTYEVIDSNGKKPDPSVTVPDKNNLYQVRERIRRRNTHKLISATIGPPKGTNILCQVYQEGATTLVYFFRSGSRIFWLYIPTIINAYMRVFEIIMTLRVINTGKRT